MAEVGFADRPGALNGLRVIDLTQMLAGPYASMLLADQGADVIKIEPIQGDYTRSIGPFREGDDASGLSGYFQSVNRNKRSLSIDLKTPEGRKIIEDLIRSADVVIENFSSGVMDRLGLSYESLKVDNPRLVYGAIRGFGDARTGRSPYVDWAAYDVVAQAMGGIMGITGADQAAPIKVGPGAGDIVPAMLCAFGVMSAVYHAQKTGQGQFVDVSMVDSMLALCERIVYQHSYLGVVPRPQGNCHPFLTPFGVVKCEDGHVAIACHTDALWKKLCDLMECPDLAFDERFSTENARRAHSTQTYAVVEQYTRHRTKAKLIDRFGGKIPFGPVFDIDDIWRDLHFKSREMIAFVEQPGSDEPIAVAGTPIRMTRTPGGVRRRAPLLSEDAAEIVATVGIDAAGFAALKARGVVG